MQHFQMALAEIINLSSKDPKGSKLSRRLKTLLLLLLLLFLPPPGPPKIPCPPEKCGWQCAWISESSIIVDPWPRWPVDPQSSLGYKCYPYTKFWFVFRSRHLQ